MQVGTLQINPAFQVPFPELADDSYATIGLIGPASFSGIVNAADPSIVEDADKPFCHSLWPMVLHLYVTHQQELLTMF